MSDKKGKKEDADLAQQDVLQAIVLADSFAPNFRPITYEKPKVLLPLANLPMIEYTLEFLAAGGVQEIFIFCCAHADAVESYVKESKLARRLATVRLRVIRASSNVTSAGDALREMDALAVIKSDFILVPGDVVSNLSLAPLVAAHKARKETDRDAVLTTVMARVPTSHRARRAGEAKLVALSGETGRLVMYDEVGKGDWEHKVRIPMSMMMEADKLELHSDLYDTHIDVCTPDFLALCSDNFDWQDLRRDMIPGVLGQFEYLGKTIYTHVTTTEYAARVHDPHTYDVVSRDIIQRWTYPLVPDANLLPECTYRCGAHCLYKEAGVTLARSAVLSRDCVIGAGASIGDRTNVESSVIGRGCKIGAGVTIHGSYLWGNVTVEDGASLNGCICADGVIVGKGAIVPPGCVLGANVRVGAGSSLPRYARFHAAGGGAEEEDDDDDEEDDEDGDDADDADAEEGAHLVYSEGAARRATAAATAAAHASSPSGDGGALLGSGGSGRLWRVVPTAMSVGYERTRVDGPVPGEESEESEEEMEEGDEEEIDIAAFSSEVGDTVRRAVQLDHTVDNLALEINSLKFAQDRTFADCVRAIVPSLLDEPSLGARPKKEKVAWVKKRVARWKGLLEKFVQGVPERTALIEALVGTYATAELIDVFQHALLELYERDLLPQEAILGWADRVEAEGDEGSEASRCLDKASSMIEWLRSEDDDDDDDESDDDEEE